MERSLKCQRVRARRRHMVKARVRVGRFAVTQACSSRDISWPIALVLRLERTKFVYAHADARSVGVRYDGVDTLADPGTYCYQGEPERRNSFQPMVQHNTVEIDRQWQSVLGGAFLSLGQTWGNEIDFGDDARAASWIAEHDAYESLRTSTVHRRAFRLDRGLRAIEVTDSIIGGSHYLLKSANPGESADQLVKRQIVSLGESARKTGSGWEAGAEAK